MSNDTQTDSVKSTLAERGKSYGSYLDQSCIAENLMRQMEQEEGWKKFPPTHRQAARMIAIKLARLLNGDPDHADSWHDIAGYATLAEQNCNKGDKS